MLNNSQPPVGGRDDEWLRDHWAEQRHQRHVPALTPHIHRSEALLAWLERSIDAAVHSRNEALLAEHASS
ncbi:MAG: hypothetical protein ACR2LX_12885 [Jatrophihabitans sp.]